MWMLFNAGRQLEKKIVVYNCSIKHNPNFLSRIIINKLPLECIKIWEKKHLLFIAS